MCDDNVEQFHVGLVGEQELLENYVLYDSSDCGEISEENSNDSFDDDSNGEENETAQNDESDGMKNFLRHWAVDKNISLTALSSLGNGLKSFHPACFNNLPVDGRTLMKTPLGLNVEIVSPGHYIHIGLVKQLTIIGNTLKNPSTTNLGLLFNIDGLPLFRSSQSELYPILFTIRNLKELKNRGFPVSLYYGGKNQ